MEFAYELTPLVACKLIVYTFGALVYLFLMVLILGNRRLKWLEWLLFGLVTALFMWNSGNLLAINAGLYYGVPPQILSMISRLIPFVGLILCAPLMVHFHSQYFEQLSGLSLTRRVVAGVFYLPLAAAPWMIGRLLGQMRMDPMRALGGYWKFAVAWVVAALLASAAINSLVVRRRSEPDPRTLRLHKFLAVLEAVLGLGFAWVYLARPLPVQNSGGYVATILMLAAVVPGGLVGYSTFRYNFLNLRVQRNVAYSVAAIFAVLIYFNFMRRLSGFLEIHEILPSAVTEGVMIFLLVVCVEPVKKLINRALHRAFVSEFGKIQRLAAEIQEHAKQSGNVEDLKRFVEERVRVELGMERVELRLGRGIGDLRESSKEPRKVRSFPIRRGTELIGVLRVTPVTSNVSGEQFGELEVLADQLAAAVELCQLIADRIRLERELAEKAKMAFLGEMSARIAHNVKNPLSSMKTLVQLLERDASLPERARQDCRLVVAEIDRLNGNISQVLRYAKPARDTDRPCDLAAVVSRTLILASAEAARRGVKLDSTDLPALCRVEGGEEAASDIISNLVVNALEVTPAGGKVKIEIREDGAPVRGFAFVVEDEGPGIPPGLEEKIFQPFFTTRPGGTGLGLAIVKRRTEEIGGAVECTSPLGPNGGSRFVVRFRAAR